MRTSITIFSSLLLVVSLSACGAGAPGGSDGSAGAGAGSVSVGDAVCGEHPGNGETSMSESEYAMAADVWCLTNDARAQNDLPPLVWGDAATEVAYDHSVFQRNQGGISHEGPGGNSPGDRLTEGGVSWSSWAENVAVGQSSPTSVVNAWLGSSGHYRNIMSTSITHIGVGVEEGSGGPYNGPWWTQVFYRP